MTCSTTPGGVISRQRVDQRCVAAPCDVVLDSLRIDPPRVLEGDLALALEERQVRGQQQPLHGHAAEARRHGVGVVGRDAVVHQPRRLDRDERALLAETETSHAGHAALMRDVEPFDFVLEGLLHLVAARRQTARRDAHVQVMTPRAARFELPAGDLIEFVTRHESSTGVPARARRPVSACPARRRPSPRRGRGRTSRNTWRSVSTPGRRRSSLQP
jgi:hypothetical protein